MIGLGFGAAAVQVASVMEMAMWQGDGTPVEGARIRIPVNLELPPPDRANGPAPKP